MKDGNKYTAEQKEKAVLFHNEQREKGMNIQQIADSLKVPKSTLTSWTNPEYFVKKRKYEKKAPKSEPQLISIPLNEPVAKKKDVTVLIGDSEEISSILSQLARLK